MAERLNKDAKENMECCCNNTTSSDGSVDLKLQRERERFNHDRLAEPNKKIGDG